MNKNQIRKEILKTRNNVGHKSILSRSISKNVIDYIENKLNIKNAKIGSFLSLKNEVDTTDINSYFKYIFLPIVHPFSEHRLWFTRDTKSYYLNKYSIKEPRYNIQDIIAPWELDIIIVPTVGFNLDKYRMGMGGGFYDFSLQFKKSQKSPITMGIAFDEQQNNDIIIDEYDIKLDSIITPTRIL